MVFAWEKAYIYSVKDNFVIYSLLLNAEVVYLNVVVMVHFEIPQNVRKVVTIDSFTSSSREAYCDYSFRHVSILIC